VYYSERDQKTLTYLISNAEEAKERGEGAVDATNTETVKVAMAAFAKVSRDEDGIGWALRLFCEC
jgi:hypothetical protein